MQTKRMAGGKTRRGKETGRGLLYHSLGKFEPPYRQLRRFGKDKADMAPNDGTVGLFSLLIRIHCISIGPCSTR